GALRPTASQLLRGAARSPCNPEPFICRSVSVDSMDFSPVRVVRDVRRFEEGAGTRFSVSVEGLQRDAFVVRYRGGLYAYLNTCRHELLQLDFGDARFFDEGYDALVCCHHGARYRPETGECIDGPCAGGRLTALALEERDLELWCV